MVVTLHLSIGVANAMGCDVTATIGGVVAAFAPNDVDAPASIDSYYQPAIEIVQTMNVTHGDGLALWWQHADLAQLQIARVMMVPNLFHCPANDFAIDRAYYLKTYAVERHAICASSYAVSYSPAHRKL